MQVLRSNLSPHSSQETRCEPSPRSLAAHSCWYTLFSTEHAMCLPPAGLQYAAQWPHICGRHDSSQSPAHAKKTIVTIMTVNSNMSEKQNVQIAYAPLESHTKHILYISSRFQVTR